MEENYPLTDCTYDVVAIIHEKSKALEAYEQYIADAGNDDDLKQCLEDIRLDEHRHIDELKGQLGRLLHEGGESSLSTSGP